MSFAGGKLIWMNGQMVPWEQATVHVMAHALHYGSSVFEGIRVYKTPDGPQVFRLTDHMQRFFDSAKTSLSVKGFPSESTNDRFSITLPSVRP